MRWKTAPLILAMVVGLGSVGGCVHHYHDQWSDSEVVYYNRWEAETHRPHIEYAQRNAADQHAYWEWRHSHQDDNH
jgi:hypothetical protein